MKNFSAGMKIYNLICRNKIRFVTKECDMLTEHISDAVLCMQ